MTIHINAFLRWSVQTTDVHRYLFRCTDTRPKPQIPTWQMAWLCVLGPLLGMNSLLQIDALARQPRVLRLLGVTNSHQAASDSAIERMLECFEREGANEYLDHQFRLAKARGQIGVLLDAHLYSAVGIDGSVFGHRHAVAALHMGDVPLFGSMVMSERGKELPDSKKLLLDLDKRLPGEFDLVVADALYLNGPHLDFVTETLQKTAVVKYRPHHDAQLPDLLDDVERMIAMHWDTHDGIVEEDRFSGTGRRRKHLRYQVQVVRGLRNLRTVQSIDVAKVTVTNTTAPPDTVPEVFYVAVCGLIHLSPRAMARIGRLRWQEENEGFRLLNAVVDSKHLYSHKESVTGSLLLLMMIGFNLLRLYYEVCFEELVHRYRGLKQTLRHCVLLLRGSVGQLRLHLAPNTS